MLNFFEYLDLHPMIRRCRSQQKNKLKLANKLKVYRENFVGFNCQKIKKKLWKSGATTNQRKFEKFKICIYVYKNVPLNIIFF